MDPHAKPLEAALAQRINNLQSTAEYIVCLAEIVAEQMRDVKEHVRQIGKDAAGMTEWGRMEIVLNLLREQAHIVGDVSEAFDIARVETVA